jgi:hypothetical protein
MILFLRSDVEGKSEDLFQWATEEELILFLGPSGRPSPSPPSTWRRERTSFEKIIDFF